MADIEKILAIRDEASANVAKVAKSLRDLANEEKAADAAAREAAASLREVAAASRRLDELGASGNKIQEAAVKLRNLKEEVRGLVASTGNENLGKKIIGEAEKDFAALVAGANQGGAALTQMGVSGASAGKAMSLNRAQIMSLKDAVFDFTNTLVAGGNPFTALVQQGPQVLEVVSSIDGGFAGLANTAKAQLLPALSAVGPYAAAVAIAAATMASAYVIVSDTWNDAAEQSADLNRETVDQALNAKTAAEEVQKLAVAWGAFQDKAKGAATDFAVMAGEIDAIDVAAAEKKKELSEAAAQNLRASGEEVGKLTVALQAAQALAKSANYSDRKQASTAIPELEKQLDAATAALKREKDALDLAKLSVDAYTEGKKEEEAREKAARAATEAATAARKAQTDADRKAADEKRRASEAERKAAAEANEMERQIRENLKRRAEERKQTEAVMLMAAQAEYDALEQLRQAEANLKAERGSAISATTAGITGGPQAGVDAVANAGPWGELVAGLAGMVTTMGDTTTDADGNVVAKESAIDAQGNLKEGYTQTDGTLSQMQSYHTGLMDAIANLPRTLADNMGSIFSDSFATIIPDFVDSFTDAFPELIGGIIGGVAGTLVNLLTSLMIELPIALVKGFLAIFTADFWINIGESIVKAFNDAFAGTDNITTTADDKAKGSAYRSGDKLHEGADGGRTRGFDTGTTYVAETGLAIVHKGEDILNSTGGGSERQMAERGRRGSRVAGLAAGVAGRIRMTLDIDESELSDTLSGMRARGYA